MKLFLDVTNIAKKVFSTTPTGLERVEFAYASALLRREMYFSPESVIVTKTLTGLIPRDAMLEILKRVEHVWRLQTLGSEDVVYGALRAHLQTQIGTGHAQNLRFSRPGRSQWLPSVMIHPLWSLLESPIRLRRCLSHLSNNQAVYLNLSNNHWDESSQLSWITKRPSMQSVFFVHDTIALDYPEFYPTASLARHVRRLDTISKIASLVIVNSETTRNSLMAYLQNLDLPVPRIEVLPLAVADAFLDHRKRSQIATRSETSAGLKGRHLNHHPYFVTVGTIEPRKNLLFLFAVWRRLVQRHGERTPRLVIVGKRGWENENVLDVLDRSKELAPFCVEVSDLSDAALADLLSAAVAILQPSTVEGYGLPIIEGLTLGLPVVASNIPAHREVGGRQALFVDPIDGPGWVEIVEQLSDPSADLRCRAIQSSLTFSPQDWPSHVEAALKLIKEVNGPIGNRRPDETKTAC